MKEKTKELGNSNVLFDFYGKRPEMSQLVPLSLQHVLAAIVGVITPSMIIAGVCGLTDAEKTMMIQAALIFTALATFLQLFPLFHKIGAALPVIMGTSFAYVPTLTAIGGEFGIGAIMGARTCAPAMEIISDTARSNIPALGYAGTYAIANVLLTLAGTLIIIIWPGLG